MVTESTSTEKVSRRDGPHRDLWSCFEEIVASDYNVPSGSRNLEEEVNAFLALPLQPLQSCPYTWWLSNKQVYPNIFDIALTIYRTKMRTNKPKLTLKGFQMTIFYC